MKLGSCNNSSEQHLTTAIVSFIHTSNPKIGVKSMKYAKMKLWMLNVAKENVCAACNDGDWDIHPCRSGANGA